MNIVIKVNDETKNKMKEYYKDKIREKTPPYAIFQAEEEDTIITLYESGKCMFQGTSADVDASMWQAQIENNIKEEPVEINETSCGSDEVGTGDYFGPIVVTACYVEKKDIEKLKKIGVNDSKKLTDDFIIKNTPKILKLVKYKSSILNNKEYNEKYSKENNLNKIKAIMHNKCLYNLLNEVPKPKYIIVDEFAKEKRYYEYLKDSPNIVRNITFLTKAESKNVAVAGASIISRYIFLKEFAKLQDEVKTPLPKGAGHDIDKIGEELVEKFGPEILYKVAKRNFANTERILKTKII